MHIYLRGDGLQRLRLASGLILFAFAATHFLNHALGLVGLEAMHTAQAWRTAVTRSWPGSAVLGAALLTHIGLGLYKLARRSTWRMPRWEAVQISLGLAIPFLLFPHIVNTRIAHTFFGVEDSYLYELKRLWPDNAPLQSLLLLLVWTHGCIGLHYWLRLNQVYRDWATLFRAAAILVPLLALAGFAVSGERTAEIMSDPDALAALKARSHWPSDSDGAMLLALRDGARIAFALVIAAILAFLAAKFSTGWVQSRGVAIRYVDGPAITLQPGMTLLEGSRAAGVPHASVCGGRGRCSTCRVKVEAGLETLPPPGAAEAATLQSIEAPPNVRLACQLRPLRPLTVAVVSPPGVPGPPQGDFNEIKYAVAAHVRGLIAPEPDDLVTSDPAAIARFFATKTGLAPVIRLGPDAAWTLSGAREDALGDQTVVAVVLKRDSEVATLFVAPHAGHEAVAVRGRRNRYHVVSWADAEFTYSAVSDVPAEELELLEAQFRLTRQSSSDAPVLTGGSA